MTTARERYREIVPPGPAERFGIAVLVLFLLVFPKGGIKLAGVPLTWGYLALMLTVVPFAIQLLYGARLRLVPSRFLVAAALVPFQLVVWAALLTQGTSDMGFAMSLVVSFFAIPLIFLFPVGVHLDRTDLTLLFRLVRVGVVVVAAYGIFLFVYRLRMGTFLEIPYLTINAADAGTLEDKFIDRGGVFKLISTYNNGNLYGVSILTLLPLYLWLERRTLPQAIVKLSLLLTLSRTVWLGLIVAEVLQRVYVRRPTVKTLAVLTGSLVLLAVGIGYVMSSILGVQFGFLADRNLGGRLSQLDALETAPLLPNSPFAAIYEMTYLSVLNVFGLVGFGAFVLAMFTPVGLHFAGALPGRSSTYKRALVSGLVVYLTVAFLDGAILFIPVMAFFWFVVSLLLSDNASFERWNTGERQARGVVAAGPR
jgi:hypothetical protein